MRGHAGGGGLCWACFRPHFCWGGGGAAKGLLPCFPVPKGDQPTACTLALWWLKFGPTRAYKQGVGCGFPVAGVRAVGPAGRGLESSYAGSAGRRLCVRVGVRCSHPPSVVTLLRGASVAGRSPSSGCPPPGGCRGPPSLCCGHGCPGMGPSTVPVACMPCEGILVSGAVPTPAARPQGRAAGVSRPVCPACGLCGRGGPAPAPREGRVRTGAAPPPTARPPGWLLGSAAVLWVRVCACGGPALSPLACMPCGGCVPRGWSGAVPGGVACHRYEGRLVPLVALSLPRSPALWGGRPGFREPYAPGAVGAGVGTQHRFYSVRPCELALRAVGVAEGGLRGGCLLPL